MNPKNLKISKLLSAGGAVCGECGRFNDENEGASQVEYEGVTHFWCGYCGKKTVLDMKLDANGNLVPYKPRKQSRAPTKKPATGPKKSAPRRKPPAKRK